ncbi:MAG: N-acetylglucosamine kinase [Gammaproteobacteria bacterium]|nr:N-acetylglucosamine kinase [Gammaproteobacteria bacterium]
MESLRTFLGVDGGGSKTAFVLIDEQGHVLARHTEGSAYYLEIGLGGLRALLTRGIGAVLRQASVSEPHYAFLGLPAYGEDSRAQKELDSAAWGALPGRRYHCGNDMVCGWAGALACQDGINIVAGTGSIAYGEYAGQQARAGGWGELIGDEGSAYWLAREGLTLFGRMSDGRASCGALHTLVRQHFSLTHDLDLCGAIYNQPVSARSQLAELARLVVQAAEAGDAAARALLTRGAEELVAAIGAVRRSLKVPDGQSIPVSYSGSLFQVREFLLQPFTRALAASGAYELIPPRLPPAVGAALYAMKLSRRPIGPALLETLARESAGVPSG